MDKQPGAFVIRQLAPADIPVLSALWLEASLQAHPFLGEERLKAQRLLVEQTYLPNSETWVAESDGKPVAFIGLLDNFIGGLFVAPSHQGKGLGQALVNHVQRLKGELDVSLYSANTGAHAFYLRLGFSEVSRRPHDDEGLPFEEIRMRLCDRR